MKRIARAVKTAAMVAVLVPVGAAIMVREAILWRKKR